MADLMRWHIVDTKAEFNLGVPIDNDMYFIKETKEIYKGANLYSSPVGLYTTALPTTPATNRLYIHTTDLEGKIHDGNNWITVIRPVENVVDDASANPASGAAIASYVSSAIAAGLASVNVIKRVTYSGNTRVMSFVHGNDTLTDITMSGLGMSLSYEQASGKLQLLDVTGAKIGDPVNIDLARVVYDAEYDATRKVLILYFDQAKTKYVEIPVGDIIKQVEVESTNSITMTMVENKISSAVKISAVANNALILKADGLYVQEKDLTDYMMKVPNPVEGHVPLITIDGSLVDSGKSIAEIVGGAHTVFQGKSIQEATAGKTVSPGDFCIVKNEVGTTGKYKIVTYTYYQNTWMAFTGDYDVEEVLADSKAYTREYAIAKSDIATSATMSKEISTASDTKVVSEKAVVGSLMWVSGM